MRLITRIIVVSLAVAVYANGAARSQVRQPPAGLVRQVAGPIVRSAAERTEAARRLAGIAAIAEAYLNSPFSLNARQTYVPGRGWLNTDGAHTLEPRLPDNLIGQDHLGQGWISFYPGQGTLSPSHPNPLQNEATVHLLNATGKRFLVECMVTSVHSVRATAASGGTQILNSPSAQWLSIVTAPGDASITIYANPIDSVWPLYGCEITRIQ